MADKGYEETEKLLHALEVRISKEYKQASEEAEEKLNDYMKRFETKDKLKKKALDAGLISKKDYTAWREQQIMVGERWEAVKNQLAEDYHNANVIAKNMIKGQMPEVYAINFNYGTYQVEHDAGVNTGFTLYSADTVEHLMKDNPELLPAPGKDVSRRIANGLDVRWNRQQIQSVMLQSLLLGDSIPEVAHRLAYTVGDSNHKAAIRNARTMTTGAQNAGRVNSFKRAQDMGVVLQQQWLATHDGRTRHSHRQIDYEIQEVDHEFSNGCRYPGDPAGPPSEIWNCRCSLRAVVEGLEPMARKFRDDTIEGQSYEEWKEGHSKPNPIDLPEKKARAIKASYNREYQRYSKLTNPERNQMDYMGKPKNFNYDIRVKKEYGLPGNEYKTIKIKQKAYKIDGYENIYIQNYGVDYQKTAEIVGRYVDKIPGMTDLSGIIVSNKINGVAAYNQTNNALYINKRLCEAKFVNQNLKTDFFVADTVEETLKHEMFHKKHWDRVKEVAQNTGQELMSAKNYLEEDLKKYVAIQSNMRYNYLAENVSKNALKRYRDSPNDFKMNEIIAEVLLQEDKGVVLDMELLNLVKGVFL